MLANERASSQVQRLLSLRTFPGFAGLPPSDLAAMAEYLVPRFFRAGSTLLQPGVPVKAFYLIIDGRVQILKEGRLVRELGTKQVVGGLAALTRQAEGQHVVAVEDTLCFELDRDDMEEVFEDHFEIQLAVLRSLGQELLAVRRQFGRRAGYPEIDPDAPDPEVGELWLVERMTFLRQTLPFAGAHIEAIADLAQSARELRLPAGYRLWREGDPSGFMVTLLKGVVDCFTEDGSHQFEFQPLSVLGAVDSMANAPRWYQAVCRTDVVALRGETAHLVDQMEDHPSLATQMLRINAETILRASETLAVKRDSERPPAAPNDADGGGERASVP